MSSNDAVQPMTSREALEQERKHFEQRQWMTFTGADIMRRLGALAASLPSEMAPQSQSESEQRDERGRPMTYWGGKAVPKEKHGEGPTPSIAHSANKDFLALQECARRLDAAIERERLANMRADQAEEARDAAQAVANIETTQAAYWKAKAEASQSAVVPIAWIAYRAGEVPVHFSKADGWSVEVVAEGKAVPSASAAIDLLRRIRQWDMLDASEDGPYWKREIDALLAQAKDKP